MNVILVLLVTLSCIVSVSNVSASKAIATRVVQTDCVVDCLTLHPLKDPPAAGVCQVAVVELVAVRTCPEDGAVAALTSTVVVALFNALVIPDVRPVAVPVTFVITPDAGVPSAGVTSEGDVALTGAPEPVAVVHTGSAEAPPHTRTSVVAPFASVCCAPVAVVPVAMSEYAVVPVLLPVHPSATAISVAFQVPVVIVQTDASDDRVATFVYATVPPVPKATLELSVPVKVRVLLTVAVFQAPIVSVPVPVVTVFQFTVVGVIAPSETVRAPSLLDADTPLAVVTRFTSVQVVAGSV